MKRFLILDHILITYDGFADQIINMGFEVIGNIDESIIIAEKPNEIIKLNPDAILISLELNNSKGAIALIKAVRKFSNCPVIFYSFMSPSQQKINKLLEITNTDYVGWEQNNTIKEKINSMFPKVG
jgi:chemotaxis response regulator CheB